MTMAREKAARPEDLTRLFVERANAGDVEGLAELYAPDAVLAYPPGQTTVGRQAIRAVFERMLAQRPQFKQEAPLPTLTCGDTALTSTLAVDGKGLRVQVLRRQADGSWVRIIDQPESRG